MGVFIVLVLGFGAALVAGALMGFVNGLVITKMKITPFIATLGMLGVASGATNLLSGGVDIVAVSASTRDDRELHTSRRVGNHPSHRRSRSRRYRRRRSGPHSFRVSDVRDRTTGWPRTGRVSRLIGTS